MKISYTIEIHNTSKQVFFWLEDPNRAKQWMTNVTNYKIINETPDKIGTTFTETIEENGRELEMQGELTDFIQNQKLSFYLESDIHIVKVEFILKEIDNITLLTQNAKIHFKGFMKVMIFLFGYFIKKKIINQTRKELNNLKSLCEEDT